MITAPEEIEFFLLKQNQLHFGQSEHEATPFTTETMQQKFDWNTSTEVTKICRKLRMLYYIVE